MGRGHGCCDGAAGSGWRPPSVTQSHTHTYKRSSSHRRPSRPRRKKLPGSVNHRTVGEGAGLGHRPTEPDGQAALPVSGRAGPPQPWCFHHAREGKEGQADWGSGWGGGGGSGQRRGPGRRAGVSPNFDNFPPLARPAPPRLAPPARRQRGGTQILAPDFALPDRVLPPGPPEKNRHGHLSKADGLRRDRRLQTVVNFKQVA